MFFPETCLGMLFFVQIDRMNAHLKKPLREYQGASGRGGLSSGLSSGRGGLSSGRGQASSSGRVSLARRGGFSGNRVSEAPGLRDAMELTPPPQSTQDNYEDELKMDPSINPSSSTAPPRRSRRLKNKPAPSYAEVAATPDRLSSSASPEMGSIRKPGYNNISIFDLPDDEFENTSPPPAIPEEAEVCIFATPYFEKFLFVFVRIGI